MTKSREAAEYFFSIRDTIAKRIVIFSSLLTNENIPIPSTSDSFTTDSTVPPFSDKLMLFHIVALASTVVSSYGMAIANNLRSDLQGTYNQLIAETMKFAKEGMDIMIKNGWMEQPPQVVMHETSPYFK